MATIPQKIFAGADDETLAYIEQLVARVAELEEELADAKADYLRRHKVAVDRLEQINDLEAGKSVLKARAEQAEAKLADSADKARAWDARQDALKERDAWKARADWALSSLRSFDKALADHIEEQTPVQALQTDTERTDG